MNKDFTLASILLTGIILNTGCAEKTTPIIPIVPTPQSNTQTYHAPISQHSPIISNPIPQQVVSTHTYVENNTVSYEDNLEVIPQEIIPIEENYVEENYDRYPSNTENQSQIIENSPIIENTPSIQNNTPIPQTASGSGYQLQTIQGQSIRVSEQSTGLNFPQYQGKVILLQIFGKECEYCFKEMPIIQKIQRKYRNKLQIIAIQGQDKMSSSTSSRLIRKYQMNYPIIERDEARDVLSYIGSTYGWTGVLPFIQIIKNGSTEATFADGGASYSELSEVIGGL